MATERQIAANRENAQLSTGPRTDAGKAASSSNACRHGLASRGIIITEGQQDAFSLMESDLRGTLVPEGPLQELLFKRALTGAWNLHRCGEAETAVFRNLGRPRLDPLLHPEGADICTQIQRYAKEAENSMYKAMRELAKLQEEALFRKEANQPAQQATSEAATQTAEPEESHFAAPQPSQTRAHRPQRTADQHPGSPHRSRFTGRNGPFDSPRSRLNRPKRNHPSTQIEFAAQG